jgi:glycosyltransferase involved in cell wall biosynthesis
MVHSDRSVHVVDYLWTKVSAVFSNAVWADSGSSLERVTRLDESPTRRTLSFVMQKLVPGERGRPGPTFMCWARLSDAKNFPLALEFIERIRVRYPDASFRIIGPDAGALGEIRERIRDLKLHDVVSISGSMTMEQISKESAQASFFLQLSKYEGMAMSVVEAMQLGLVPIVTPVGEPARYCRNMENAVIFSDFDQAVDEVCRLIDEPELYAKVSRAAGATWTDAPIYADDFVAAATELWRRRQGG